MPTNIEPWWATQKASQRLLAEPVPGSRGEAGQLATTDDPDAVTAMNPQIASPPTNTAGNEWDAEPVPRVLDCGPLSNNCNTQQGGEFYAYRSKQRGSAGARERQTSGRVDNRGESDRTKERVATRVTPERVRAGDEHASSKEQVLEPRMAATLRRVVAHKQKALKAIMARAAKGPPPVPTGAKAASRGDRTSHHRAASMQVASPLRDYKRLFGVAARQGHFVLRPSGNKRGVRAGTQTRILADFNNLFAGAKKRRPSGNVLGDYHKLYARRSKFQARARVQADYRELFARKMRVGKKMRATAAARLAMLASVDKGKPLLQTERKKSILDSKRGARSSTPQDSYTARSARGDEVLQQHHQQLDDDKVAVEGVESAASAVRLLSERQAALNARREAVFAKYVGPLLLENKAPAHLAVTVERYARPWLPPGAAAVPSKLDVTPLSPDKVPPSAAFTAATAASLHTDALGSEGLSLERALDALNEEQVELNEERARLFSASVGSKSLPLQAVRLEGPALLEWRSAHAAPLSSGPSLPLQNTGAGEAPPATIRSKSQDHLPATPAGGAAVTHNTLVPALEKGVREGGQRESKHFLDEAPPKHHVDPRDKVADLMKELDVPETSIAAEKSRTRDPYDPWKPDTPSSDEAAVHSATQGTIRTQAAMHRRQGADVSPNPVRRSKGGKGRSLSSSLRPARDTASGSQTEVHVKTKGKQVPPAGVAPPEVARATARGKQLGKAHAKAHPTVAGRSSSVVAPGSPQHGLPEYKSKTATSDLDAYFDSLIAQRVAVGHDALNAPKRSPPPAMSAKDALRLKEGDFLSDSDRRRVSAKRLEMAEEHVIRTGEPWAFVGSELPRASVGSRGRGHSDS